MLDEATDYGAVRGMNPTKWIEQNYAKLMQYDNAADLAQFVLSSLPEMGSFGKQNVKKFQLTLRQLANKGNLIGVQRYLSNFLLAGRGMSTGEDIECVASVITEDIDSSALTPEQERLKRLVESNSKFRVRLTN